MMGFVRDKIRLLSRIVAGRDDRVPGVGAGRMPRALKIYENADFGLQLKARFIYYLYLSSIGVVIFMFMYSFYLQSTSAEYGGMNYAVLIAEFSAIVVFSAGLVMLVKGFYAVAAHSLVVMSLLIVWTIVIVDRGDAVSRLDSLVFILAAVSMIPLVVMRYKKIIIMYIALNVLVLFFFMRLFRHQLDIPDFAVFDFLADFSIALLFTGIVAYNIFRINRASLDRAIADIEERRKAEEALAYQKSLLEAQYEASTDGILVVDGLGRMISWNRKFRQMWGIPDEILSSRSDQRALRHVTGQLRDSEEFLRRVQYLYEHPDERSSEEIFLRDGRTFDRYSSPVTGKSGEYLGRVWYFRDISDKKEAEKTIRKASEEYEMVVSSIPSIVWKCDIDSDMNFSNPYISHIADDLLCLPPGSIGNDFGVFFSYIHPDDLGAAMNAFRAAVENLRNKESIEYRVIRADGQERWFYSNGVARQEEDGRFRIFGITEDITDRKNAEEENRRLLEQLAQSQRMESVGRLAGGIAHDFNNLLTAISGNVDLSLIDMKKGRSPESHLTDAKNAAMSAAALIRQLLAFSRKQVIEPRVIDLVRLVTRSKTMLERIIGENIRLQIRSPFPQAMIKSDPGQMEQIIVNLAVNARDAMPSGGTLTIETGEALVDDEYLRQHPYMVPGRYVTLSVSDTGTGIPQEIREHLFEPFFTTKPKGKGTGLGLATTYGAVKQNGGSIEVRSEPGEGATFVIFFPGAEGTEQVDDESGEHDAPIQGGGETILLVEDDEMVRNFAANILERLGYAIMVCDTAENALEKSRQYDGTIHILITDVVLPGMNGRALADMILEKRPDVKVLYTSGYNENIIVHHGVLEPGIDFIGKPYTLESLAKKIREVMDS